MLAIALSVNFKAIPSYQIAECEQTGDQLVDKGNTGCTWRVNVTVTKDNEKFEKEARTRKSNCDGDKVITVGECWLSRSNDVFIPIDSRDAKHYESGARTFNRLRVAFIVFAIFFGLFFSYAVVRMIEPNIFRLCRPSTSSVRNNGRLRSENVSPRRPSSNFSTASPRQEIAFPTSVYQQRISSLIERSLMSPEQIKALAEQQWTCCICLEQIEEGPSISAVARLRCNHSIHAECLKTWLGKGRAACCICNAEVFSEPFTDWNESVAHSLPSVLEGRPTGSFAIEITEYTPSSPATSIVAQFSQAQSDTTQANDNITEGDTNQAV